MTQNNILLEQYNVIADFQNYAVSSYGNVLIIDTGRILRPGIDTNGYYYVILTKNKKTTINGIIASGLIFLTLIIGVVTLILLIFFKTIFWFINTY